MSKTLIIVESPSKAKTIEKYLGDVKVLACYGHVRDLAPKEGAVDSEQNFAMHYVPVEKSAKQVDIIFKAAQDVENIYLATDPDREGEAIAWHLQEMIHAKKALSKKPIQRIAFYEVTKSAVQKALQSPKEISMELVHAQQARRALDYLVGFTLSPLLWRKIRPQLSAGRVQSPALRLIVEREEAIEAFQTREYWTVRAQLRDNQQIFLAKLIQFDKEKIEQFSIENEERVLQITQALNKDLNGHLTVRNVEKKQKQRHPAAPFITSTLQQEAARKLGFNTQRTMRVAQQLYEAGLITYMRTDSVNISLEAISHIRSYIPAHFGIENLPKETRIYKTKSKNAQEAHEAIRPTHVEQSPQQLAKELESDQAKLYELIWKRTIACQMMSAQYQVTTIDFVNGDERHVFRATGSYLSFPGFLSVYQEDQDEKSSQDVLEEDRPIPPLSEKQEVDVTDLLTEQHFTEPPPRYTEASLVKALEEQGIGRPSTYAAIITTLQTREYVLVDKKRFYPTDVGRVVNRFLTLYFSQYVDYQFTAKLEDELDEISRGEIQWVPVLQKFWAPFKELVDKIALEVKKKDVTQEPLTETCPDCGKTLVIRLGKKGRFIGCSGYPDCSYTKNLGTDKTEEAVEIIPDKACPECNAPLLIRQGRYGKFIGCTQFPKCRHMEKINKPVETGVLCPECHRGKMMQKKSKRGKIFFACSEYPKCKYAMWDEPISELCPKCHWPVLGLHSTKRAGSSKKCPQKNCGYVEKISENKE